MARTDRRSARTGRSRPPQCPPSRALRQRAPALRRRASGRCAETSSSIRTRSSTACASSIPVVPTITVGIPRAQKSRMSAPHGTPATRRVAALGGDRGPHPRDPRVRRVGLARTRTRRRSRRSRPAAASSSAARTAASNAARAAAGSSPTRTPSAALEHEPVRHRARPLARLDAADRHRVGQREPAHRRMRDVRVDARLVRGERRVHARRSGRSPSGPRAASPRARRDRARCRGTSARRPARRRPRSRSAPGSGSRRSGRRARAPRTRRARRPPRTARTGARPRASPRPRPAARRARAAPRSRRPSCRRCRGRARSRRRSRPTTARGATARCPGATTSTCPSHAEPPGQRARAA